MAQSTRSAVSVLYSFPFRIGRTGIGNTAWSQVQALVDQGVVVSLACGSVERPLRGVARVRQTYSLHGRPLLPIGPLGILRAARLHDRLTARRLSSGRLRVDAVHCWPLGSRETLRIAHRLGIPTFLERPNAHTGYAYGVVMAEYRRLGLPQPRGVTHEFDPDRLRLELEEYTLTDYLLCPSEFVASTFLANGFPDEVLVRTQYGYDPTLFTPGPERAAGEGPQLLFAGSAEPRKGLHYALDAWLASRASRSGTLRICGAFTPGYREFLAARLEHPSIEVVPFTNDMPSMYRRSDALVLPSIEEGSALVTYEAMACGAALLVSDSAGAHADHMVEGLIHRTRDWQQLRDHMDLLVQQPQLLATLRSNAVRRSRGLTWKDAGRVLTEAYRSNI